METKLFLISMFWISMICFSQNTYVPDDNFEQELISLGYDDVLDDYVLTNNINTITSLNLSGKSVSDLTGIEDFTSLIVLYCEDNNLSTLDISNNTALRNLYCSNNNLSTIDISNNVALVNLQLENNNISEIDLSNNTLLIYLYLSSNNLTSLDISNNLALRVLTCENNNLTLLDVSANINLEDLFCTNNNITSLNVTNNANLFSLNCNYNAIESLDVSNNTILKYLYCNTNNIESLDVSLNPNITYLYCDNNNLSSLNVKNGNNINFMDFDATNNPNLFCIEVDNAAWSALNWTKVDSQSSFSENCSTMNLNESFLLKLNMYPNPVSDFLNVELEQDVNYFITNLNGQILQENILNRCKNIINFSRFTEGVYLITFEINGRTSTKKLIKL
jgi:Leucine-rich repeat (LRR) protein